MTQDTNERRVAVPTISTPEQICARHERWRAEFDKKKAAQQEPLPQAVQSPQFHYTPNNGQD